MVAMNIICKNCGKETRLNAEQENFLNNARLDNLTFAMLNCNVCGSSFPINPQNIEMMPENIENNALLRCPIESCYGYINKVDNFYGCGECGNIWKNKNEIYRDIKNIISKYPYRNKAYIKERNRFIPNKNGEPDNYEDLVRKELAG